MSNKTVQNGKGSARRSGEDRSALARNWPKNMKSAFDLRLEAELKADNTKTQK